MEKRTVRTECRFLWLPVWNSVRTELVFSEATTPIQKSTAKPIKEARPSWVIGSWFLKDCLKELCKKADEDMHIVCGLNFKNCYTLERISKFRLSRQSLCGVEGDISSILTSLIAIEENGYFFTGWFHSHPGQSPGSVHESSIDIKTQKLLEAGNYVAIGGVFSRDGYVKFFSDQLEFNVMVLGEGVEKIDENLFKISTAS